MTKPSVPKVMTQASVMEYIAESIGHMLVETGAYERAFLHKKSERDESWSEERSVFFRRTLAELFDVPIVEVQNFLPKKRDLFDRDVRLLLAGAFKVTHEELWGVKPGPARQWTRRRSLGKAVRR